MVHGSDGLDEITTTGPTSAWEIRDGAVEERILEPADFAVQTAKSEDLRGGDREVNLRDRQRCAGGRAGSAARYRAGECRRGAGGRREGGDASWKAWRSAWCRSIRARRRERWRRWRDLGESDGNYFAPSGCDTAVYIRYILKCGGTARSLGCLHGL